MKKESYPSPCDNCSQSDYCTKYKTCQAWLTRYLYKQKQINAYAKKVLPAFIEEHKKTSDPVKGDKYKDYVQVVRCADCRNCVKLDDNKNGGFYCERIVEFVKTTDFCSHGERKEDDEPRNAERTPV